MPIDAAMIRKMPARAAGVRRRGSAPVRSPFDTASLVVVAILALLFAAAITVALQPAHLVDPLQASLQNGL